MTMTAIARPIAGSLRQLIDVNGRHTMVTDEPARLGGTDVGPTPHELLPAALAGCISTMIAMYARPRDLDIEGLSVEVAYDAEVTPRDIGVTVHIPPTLTPAQAARIRLVAETCPVKRAFEVGFIVDEQFVAYREPDLSPPVAERESDARLAQVAGGE
ncbi:MAG: OsmC family protein [Solirubrobacteraceae bacterium]